MSGYPIPNDWDGSTFKCHKVYWPNSERYEALLLGQLSKPQQAYFWDQNTGDVLEAIDAIVLAENATIPTFFSENCEPMLPPVAAFKYYLGSNQTLPSNGDFAKVNLLASQVYDVNDTGWLGTQSTHFPYIVQRNNGLWRYTAIGRLASGILGSIRLVTTSGGVIATARGNQIRLVVTGDFLWQGETIGIVLEAQADGGGTLFSGSGSTHLSAVYLGPVE